MEQLVLEIAHGPLFSKTLYLCISDGKDMRVYDASSSIGTRLRSMARSLKLDLPIFFPEEGEQFYEELRKYFERDGYDGQVEEPRILSHSLKTNETRWKDGRWGGGISPVKMRCPECRAPYPSYGNYKRWPDCSYNCTSCKFSIMDID